MEQDDLNQPSTKPAVPEIRNTLIEMCRPFGPIDHWRVESANDGLFRCFVRLADPRKHLLMVRTLGGRLQGRDVCLDIRLRRRLA